MPLTVSAATATDTPPVLLNAPSHDAMVGTAFTFTANGYDADGNPIRYALPVAPQGMVIDPVTGELQWTPGPNQTGHQSFLLVVSDDQGGSTPYQLQVSVPVPGSVAPVFTSPASEQAAVNQSNAFPVTAYVPDGRAVTLSTDPIFTLPPGVTLDSADGLLLWTPTQEGSITAVVDASAMV